MKKPRKPRKARKPKAAKAAPKPAKPASEPGKLFFTQKQLASLPESRAAVSYMVGIDNNLRHVLFKFRMADGRSETYMLTPGQAKFVLKALRKFYAALAMLGKPIPDARKTADKALIEAFEASCPQFEPDDWNGNPPEGTRQTVAAQVDSYSDAVFLIFAMNPIEKQDYRAVRLDPRLCYWIVDIIGEQEAALVDVGSMPPPSQSIN